MLLPLQNIMLLFGMMAFSECPRMRPPMVFAVIKRAKFAEYSVPSQLSKMIICCPAFTAAKITLAHSSSSFGAPNIAGSRPVVVMQSAAVANPAPVPACGLSVIYNGTLPSNIGR